MAVYRLLANSELVLFSVFQGNFSFLNKSTAGFDAGVFLAFEQTSVVPLNCMMRSMRGYCHRLVVSILKTDLLTLLNKLYRLCKK